jgi:ABC-type multidrug transport system fused ATPase/permease subunit
MITVSKAKKFLKEHTGKAIFYGLVGILLAYLISLAIKNWKLFINVLNSVMKSEHFFIYAILIVFAVIFFLLYKRMGKLQIKINEIQLFSRGNSSSKVLEQDNEPDITYFFSNNANWKINLRRKSFDKNPCCNCCKPPSYLSELPPKGFVPLFANLEENHKCLSTSKEYYLASDAYIYAYQEAREKYGVHDEVIEDEIKRLIEKRKPKTK